MEARRQTVLRLDGDRLMFASEAGIKEETGNITEAALTWSQMVPLWAQHYNPYYGSLRASQPWW